MHCFAENAPQVRRIYIVYHFCLCPFGSVIDTLIHFDLTQDLSLKSISAQLNVNPSYFSTLFRRECGCTLTDYVNQQRIDRALILLKTSDKLVQDIAAECGFSGTNYFIRLFKRHTGVTPNQYREGSVR